MQRSNQLLRRFLYQSKRSFTQTNKPETNNSPKIVEEASKGNNNDNNTNSNNGDGKGEVPKYNPIEYELFKYIIGDNFNIPIIFFLLLNNIFRFNVVTSIQHQSARNESR